MRPTGQMVRGLAGWAWAWREVGGKGGVGKLLFKVRRTSSRTIFNRQAMGSDHFCNIVLYEDVKRPQRIIVAWLTVDCSSCPSGAWRFPHRASIPSAYDPAFMRTPASLLRDRLAHVLLSLPCPRRIYSVFGPRAPFGGPVWKPFLNFLAMCFIVLIRPVPVVFLRFAFSLHSSVRRDLSV
jgi:hypothetical protein